MKIWNEQKVFEIVNLSAMQRYSRYLLKWSLVTGTSVLLFKLCCDSLVKILLSSSMNTNSGSSSIGNDLIALTYENPMVAWASTGQRSANLVMNKEHIEMKSRDDLQLIGAQIFFRHGARTPLNFLPGLEEVIYTKEHIESFPPTKRDIKLITKLGDKVVSRDKIISATEFLGDRIRPLKSASGEKIVVGQLTAIGEKQLYELGRLLQKELMTNENGLLSNRYDPKTTYCRSTFMDRTIASARSFLAGLFSSETSTTKIQTTTDPFEIEVHHFPDEDLFPNPSVYTILNKCHNAESLYASLNDEHELKKARQKLINHIGVKDYKHGIVELHDEIVSRQAHGFPVTDDLLELTKDFRVMSAREYIVMATNIGFDVFVRATFGAILHMIKENFDSILKYYIEEKENNEKISYHKLFVYSGHDTTLIPLAMALEIFDMQWPQYASYILMKYYVSKTDSTDTYVTVNYAGRPQKLPNSDDYYCPYSTFLKNLENRMEKPRPPPSPKA